MGAASGANSIDAAVKIGAVCLVAWIVYKGVSPATAAKPAMASGSGGGQSAGGSTGGGQQQQPQGPLSAGASLGGTPQAKTPDGGPSTSIAGADGIAPGEFVSGSNVVTFQGPSGPITNQAYATYSIPAQNVPTVAAGSVAQTDGIAPGAAVVAFPSEAGAGSPLYSQATPMDVPNVAYPIQNLYSPSANYGSPADNGSANAYADAINYGDMNNGDAGYTDSNFAGSPDFSQTTVDGTSSGYGDTLYSDGSDFEFGGDQ